MAERITWELKKTQALLGGEAEGDVPSYLAGNIIGDIEIWATQLPEEQNTSIMSFVVTILALSPHGYITLKIQSDYNIHPYLDLYSLWGFNGEEFEKMKANTVSETRKGVISYCEKHGLDIKSIKWNDTRILPIDPIKD